MPIMQATIADGGTTTDVIDIGTSGFLSGAKFPAMTTDTSVAVHVCEKRDGTFTALEDGAGNAVTIACATSGVSAAEVSNITAVAGWRYFKLVAGSAQSGAKNIFVAFRTERD
jgi:hypothetical protein